MTPDTAPDLDIDLQIGLYTLVVRALRDAWGLPEATAAGYAYTDHRNGPERFFGSDRGDELAQTTARWLGVARGLLQAGQYPRTPNEEDCTFCHLRRACGPGATIESARLLARSRGARRAFAILKGVEVDDEEDAP